MANPKSRHSNCRRDKRRANWKGVAPNVVECSECGEPKVSHRICPSCGMYKGKTVLEVVEKD